MSRLPLVLVAAVARNRVIGGDNRLLWRLPGDLRRFKALTLGKPILMGRKTWASLGRPLPGRDNIVLTRDAGLERRGTASGAIVVHSVAEVLARFADVPEIAVIGGAELYRLVLPIADRIELTRVHARIPGDTYFPELKPEEWRVVASAARPADERHAHAMSFETLERVRPS